MGGTPESFTDILVSDDDEKRKWKQGYIPAAEEELLKFIPEELRDFILTKPTMAFFLLPSANYSHCGVPCLDFYKALLDTKVYVFGISFDDLKKFIDSDYDEKIYGIN